MIRRRLSLRREMVRALTADELRPARGGGPTQSGCNDLCPSTNCTGDWTCANTCGWTMITSVGISCAICGSPL